MDDNPAAAPAEAVESTVQQTSSTKDQLCWKKGICGICPAACWVEVGLDNGGKLKDIRQDTSHPLGMLCHRGKHAADIIYSPHRLQTPMRRIADKGADTPIGEQFEAIGWDQAYALIAEKFNQIKAESGPEATAIYTGRGAFELSLCDMYQPKDVAVSSASNILFPFGSPNTMGVGALCYVSYAMIAPHVTMGRMLVNMYTDMENAEMLLVWGTNPATDSPPLDMYRLEAAAKRGCDIVGIDPRHTESLKRTGAQWVPIRPGTDGALALSMIEVMIEEELYDEAFAENWCQGFDELKTYVQHFTPEVAASITGVDAETIRDLTRRLCAAEGAAPVMYTGLEYSDSGIQAIRAVFTLFALAGHLDSPGGIGLSMLGNHFPINRESNQPNPNLDKAVARDRFPLYSHYRGESHALGLVDAVLKGEPYPIRGLIIHGASITTSWPQSQIWRETLSKLDFVVSIDRQFTADSAFADLVLPATTMFEIDSYAVYGNIFRLREKLIEPVGEARNDYLIMAQIAEALGYGELYPQTEQAMIEQALKGSGFSLEEVRANGGWVKTQSPMMEYKKWEKGHLRPDGQPGFDTPSGKFEIWSSTLEDFGYEPLPKYTEPKEGPLGNPELAKQFPLVFNSGARTQTEFRSQHHNVQALVKDNPEPLVELSRQDAERRGIKTGDLVSVSTPRGSVPFRALVSDDIVEGAVEVNMGGGVPTGPKAWQLWNANELTDIHNLDEISGFPVYKALLCEVTKKADGDSIEAVKNLAFERAQASKLTVKAKPSRRIYLDNNATSPLAESVRQAMQPYLEADWGNPSSIHSIGKTARDAMEKARREVAGLLGCLPKRIIFTGGGSEADNLALKGLAFKELQKPESERRMHIVTTAIEHPAILQTAEFLKTLGFAIDYLAVNRDGLVSVESLKQSIRNNTLVVSVMLANNEVGSIQPIQQLAQIAHQFGALFHTDAVQAAGKIAINVDELGVDLLTISAHKFHGPKGIGALYKAKSVELEPLIHGGKQEAGFRAGTENIAAIVGMGEAARVARQLVVDADKIQQLRDKLEQGIRRLIPDAVLNGHPTQRLPNTLNLTLPGLRGESLVVALDQHGIFLSSGSACKSGSPKPTQVLMAMGRSEEEAHCSIRLSLGDEISDNDIDETLMALKEVLEEMETTVRFLSCK